MDSGFEKIAAESIAVADVDVHRLTFAQSIAAYFRLWRYEARQVILCFICMYVGWMTLAGTFDVMDTATLARAATATVAATFVLLSAFLTNDAADRDIDRVVHPERPIPRGESDHVHIYWLGGLLAAAAVALATLVSARFFVFAAALAGLTVGFYGFLKHRLKVPLSAELIAPAVSALFPLSAFAVAAEPRPGAVVPVVLFIYFADFAQDLLGGIHDVDGDRRLGLRTFAIQFGGRPTLAISFAAFVVSMVAGAYGAAESGLGWIYLVTFVTLAAMMLTLYLRLARSTAAMFLERAATANHLGGFYFFVVSAALLPDFLVNGLLR
jgi:geranylgeranylglycerol-phosphate geranylgeranyltransferase